LFLKSLFLRPDWAIKFQCQCEIFYIYTNPFSLSSSSMPSFTLFPSSTASSSDNLLFADSASSINLCNSFDQTPLVVYEYLTRQNASFAQCKLIRVMFFVSFLAQVLSLERKCYRGKNCKWTENHPPSFYIFFCLFYFLPCFRTKMPKFMGLLMVLPFR
jgi:hypothetical protein